MRSGYYYALLASALFAISTPVSKVLLGGINPVLLAGLCYLGSGLGLFAMQMLNPSGIRREAAIAKTDIKWLLGTVFCGGIMAPILLMTGLAAAKASNVSLLLNFEIIFTAAIAGIFFGESLSSKVYVSAALLTAGAIMLAYEPGRISLGADRGMALVLGACLFWALDNNLTAKISNRNPAALAMWKGLAAGTVNIIIAAVAAPSLPDARHIIFALLLGLASYGLSLVFLIRAMRALGAARSGALFGTYPFIAALLCVVFLKDALTPNLSAAAALCAAAAALLLTETHSHPHSHSPLAHEHSHVHDEHHRHPHGGADLSEPHSHVHEHAALTHSHPHTPDEHHRHGH